MIKLKHLTAVVMTAIIITAALPMSTFKAVAGQPGPKITTQKVDGATQDSMENYSFVPDKDAVGEWEVYDFVEKTDGYDPARANDTISDKNKWMYRGNSVYEDGTVKLRFDGSDQLARWTKGFMVWDDWKVVPAYEIKNINGARYMFVEWKNNDYTAHGKLPGYYVFKKISDEPAGWAEHMAERKFIDTHRPKVKAEYDKWSDIPANERNLPIGQNVPFRIMWLMYTNVRLDRDEYKMTDEFKDLVFDTMEAFEGKVERITDGNVDIINEYQTIDRRIDVSKTYFEQGDARYHYISSELAQNDINKYAPESKYSFVFTLAQKNQEYKDTGPNIINGKCTDFLMDGQGRANINIAYGNPKNAVSLAVHEFLHAFEFSRSPGYLPGIEMPWVHAIDTGRDSAEKENFPGYEGYDIGGKFHSEGDTEDEGQMPFYESFLMADIKYIDPVTKKMKYVGIFPSMWEYVVEYQEFLAQNK